MWTKEINQNVDISAYDSLFTNLWFVVSQGQI